MQARLFEDLVVSRSAGRKTRAGGLPFSLAVHVAALGGLILVSAIVPEDLPATTGTVVIPGGFPAPRPAPPAAAPAPPRRSAPQRSSRPDTAVLQAPRVDDAEILPDPFAPEQANVDGCAGCAPDSDGPGDPAGVPGGLGPGGGGGTALEPAPRLRVGGAVQAPRKMRHVDPVYPELARRAGVTGIVILECVIDRDGTVRSVAVLRGHPLLDDAAAGAVRQWTYRPTLLNGVPVEIVMVVTVRFTTR